MRGIFTRKQALFCILITFFVTSTSSSFGQNCSVNSNLCESIDITYPLDNLPAGTTGGFTGDFEYRGPQSNNANSSSGLQSKTPLTPKKEILTPSFTISPDAVLLFNYRFTLEGTANVTSFDLSLVSNSGEVISLCQGGTPVYRGGKAVVCGSFGIPASVKGKTVRLKFTFNVVGSTNHRVVFDDMGLDLGGAAIILPVKIHSLSAKKVAIGTQVTWNVGEETNVSHYELQRGTNGADFTTVGLIFAGGKESYSLTDTKPSQGVVFYRIMSVDNDKKYKYSTVISFANGKALGILRAYPMPARNSITVQHALVESKAQISISSQDGKLVKTVTPATGSMETPIDLSSLKAGMYLLRFADASGQAETLKIVKQ